MWRSPSLSYSPARSSLTRGESPLVRTASLRSAARPLGAVIPDCDGRLRVGIRRLCSRPQRCALPQNAQAVGPALPRDARNPSSLGVLGRRPGRGRLGRVPSGSQRVHCQMERMQAGLGRKEGLVTQAPHSARGLHSPSALVTMAGASMHAPCLRFPKRVSSPRAVVGAVSGAALCKVNRIIYYGNFCDGCRKHAHEQAHGCRRPGAGLIGWRRAS